ncbi:MAG: replicative DNA helicase [Chloroflexota bacterium]
MVNQPAYISGESLLPSNVEAEQAVLGSLLIDPRAVERIASFLRPEDFYLPVNGEIYRGMLVLYERDRPSDYVTLVDYLDAQGRLDDMGGPAYVASLTSMVPTSINVEYYARIVERLAVLRRLVEAGGKISAIGQDPRLEADDALEEAERVLFDISRLRVMRDFQPLSSVLSEVYEKIDHIHSHESEITGVTTGFIDMDRLTSGMQRSDLIILAARPSMGKTALALNIAHSVAVNARLPVGIFSVEMSAEQLANRLISIQAQIDSQKLRSGRMSDVDWDRLVQAIGVLSEAPIFVDDTPGLSTVEMRSKARRLHTEQGLGLLIVDYLQLMQGATTDSRVQEISAISRALKAVARELDIPVLALSQLSRAPEQRPNHEPMLSDLRESGSIEQDADIVLFIYRDKVYNPETERPHVADVIVAKHRNGPTGKIHLFFQEQLMRFLDLSVRDDG